MCFPLCGCCVLWTELLVFNPKQRRSKMFIVSTRSMCAQRLIIKLNSFGEPILSHLDYLLYISGWNNYPITLIGAPSNLCASCLVHSCCNRCYGNSYRHTLWKTTTRQAAWSLQGCHIRPHSGLPLV